uniref:Uncharacterized protein n=1 Tax=Cannabis sativa TaxID=3483 RepID=A0A803Q7E2_CANSA
MDSFFVPRQYGSINPPQGVGHPQVLGIQAPNVQALQGAQNTLAAVVVVAFGLRNLYHPGAALPALDGHATTISGGSHTTRGTQNGQKNELNQGEACHLV